MLQGFLAVGIAPVQVADSNYGIRSLPLPPARARERMSEAISSASKKPAAQHGAVLMPEDAGHLRGDHVDVIRRAMVASMGERAGAAGRRWRR